MKDLRTIKRRFTRIARGLFPQRAWSGTRAFQGVIQPAFGVWLHQHWALSKPGWFQPVPKDFQKQKKTFELVTAPRRERAGDIRYTFSPTIQLTSFPAHTSNSFFEIDAARIFQTLTPKHFSSETRAVLLRESRSGSITRTREQLTVNREIQSGRSSKLAELLSTLFSTLSRTVGEIKRSKTNEKDFPAKPQSYIDSTSLSSAFAPLPGHARTTNLRNSFANTFQHNQFTDAFQRKQFTNVSQRNQFAGAFQRNQFARSFQRNQLAHAFQSLIFAGDSRHTTNNANSIFNRANSTSQRFIKTTPLHLHMDQWLVMPRKGPQIDGEFRAAPNVFTAMDLRFTAPKAAETELVHERISQFVSSPALTYAKRQQAISEGMVQTFRALQTSQEEPKRVAPPALPSIEQITSQVKMELDRELRIERQRRGL